MGTDVVTRKDDGDSFVWKRGRVEVVVVQEGSNWVVLYISAGRLLGPPQILHEGRHRLPTHAAWDVMARVIRASRDEEEGMRVARDATRWMKGRLVGAGLPAATEHHA